MRTDKAQDALWSALEVQTQAEQCAGQVDIWEAVEETLRECPRCGGTMYHDGERWTCQDCPHDGAL